MTAFMHVWHWLRSDAGILAATLATILGATILYTLARTTPGVRPGAPRDRIADLNGVNAWRERDERILRREMHAAAGRLFPDPPAHDGDGPSPAWPPDLCHKHRLGSSQSRGHDVIQAVVTDLPEPWDSRWTR